MSLTNVSLGASPASLTVDELEAKLTALHDYLSTPYRSRAESILQQRRRREGTSSVHVPTATPSPMERNESLQGPQASPFTMANREDRSVAQDGVTSQPTWMAVAAGAVESPSLSLFTESIGRTERGSDSKDDETSRRSTEGQDSREREARPVRAPTVPVAHPQVPTSRVPAERRRERLEWQVEMLADALREERLRFAQVQEQVVLPLQAMVEALLQRQVELEGELLKWRENTKSS